MESNLLKLLLRSQFSAAIWFLALLVLARLCLPRVVSGTPRCATLPWQRLCVLFWQYTTRDEGSSSWPVLLETLPAWLPHRSVLRP
jgi:hypothetical protein